VSVSQAQNAVVVDVAAANPVEGWRCRDRSSSASPGPTNRSAIGEQPDAAETQPRQALFRQTDGQEKIITNWAGNPPKNKTKLTQLPQSSTKKNPHGTERELASLQLFLLLKMQFQDRQAGGWNMRPPFADAAALHWMEY
jgi:hypothetical protein